MERWRGRVALVTGASSGIGASICRHLVRHGMTVVGCARSVQRIKDMANEDCVKSSPGQLVAVKCDLRIESEILSMFQDINEKHGRLDVCINNAGLAHDAPLLTGDTSHWQNMFDVNVLAVCICTREAVKLMQMEHVTDGYIINISSLGGHMLPRDMPGAHFYCGTKSMLRVMTECTRKELKAQNSKIRISSVSPGAVETEFYDTFLKDNPHVRAVDVFNSMRCLQPWDIADAVSHLLSTPEHVEVHDVILRPTDQPE